MVKHWVEEIFEERGAIKKGHFILASEKHSNIYLDKAMIYPDGEKISDICFEMAREVASVFPGDLPNKKIEVVVGLAQGGIILAHETAKVLSEIYQRKVLSVFMEKKGKNQVFGRQAFKEIIAGSLVLIVDDILSSGGSVLKAIKEVQRCGGHVMAAVVICNRGDVRPSDIMDYPLLSLWKTYIESWKPEDCPLCGQNIPLEDSKSH